MLVFLKKILSNQAVTFILTMLIFGLILSAIGHDVVTLLQTLGFCGALWIGVGGVMMHDALFDGKLKDMPNTWKASLKMLLTAMLYGPFAHQLF